MRWSKGSRNSQAKRPSAFHCQHLPIPTIRQRDSTLFLPFPLFAEINWSEIGAQLIGGGILAAVGAVGYLLKRTFIKESGEHREAIRAVGKSVGNVQDRMEVHGRDLTEIKATVSHLSKGHDDLKQESGRIWDHVGRQQEAIGDLRTNVARLQERAGRGRDDE